jgi:hypothetical protein
MIPRKESNAMKRVNTTSTAMPSTNIGAAGKAWDEVSASFDRFCLAAGVEALDPEPMPHLLKISLRCRGLETRHGRDDVTLADERARQQ